MSLFDLMNEERFAVDPSGKKIRVPFINQKVQSIVRVIDYEPHLLEEFTWLTDAAHGYSTRRWQWQFSVLVEDADPALEEDKKSRAWLSVDHESAEFLLKMKASDLSKDSKKIAQLREKLAILWGNLEERKRAALDNKEPYPPAIGDLADGAEVPDDPLLSNLPFKCCIKEYGSKLDEEDRFDGYEWVQIHVMFGITIQ